MKLLCTMITRLFALDSEKSFLEALGPAFRSLAPAVLPRLVSGCTTGLPADAPHRLTLPLAGLGKRSIRLVLERVDRRGRPFPEEERKLLTFAGRLVSDELARRRAAGRTPPPEGLLSPREWQVVDALGEGLSNRALALRLGISESTVKRHLYNIYNKTGAESRTHLLRIVRTKEPVHVSGGFEAR